MNNKIPSVIKELNENPPLNKTNFLSFQDKLNNEFFYNDDWTIVAENSKLVSSISDELIDDTFLISILVSGDENNLKTFMENSNWDINNFGNIKFGQPQFYEIYEEERNYFDKGEQHEYQSITLKPFVYFREFHGYKNPIFDIKQDFIILFNLFFDKNESAYFKVDDNDGSLIKVINIVEKKDLFRIEIATKFLIDYLLLHGSYLVRYHDHKRFNRPKQSLVFSRNIEDIPIVSDKRNLILSNNREKEFSNLFGKDLIKPDPSESINNYFIQEEEKYETFKIKIDGKILEETCNEEELSSYFQDKGKPHFLTNVFFDKKVLKKYYDESSRFSVGKYGLGCLNIWQMPFDLIQNKFVHVWLGDLCKLPYNEQKYWKYYNITPPSVSIPNNIISRDFYATPINDRNLISLFYDCYRKVNEIFNDKYQENLFLPLKKDDHQNYGQLRRPLNEEQQEFELLILILTKIVNDSINKKLLKKLVKSDEKGSINLLTALLKGINTKLNLINEQKINRGFYILQSMRSSGVAHRKGKKYNETLKKYSLEQLNYSRKFEKILNEVINSLNAILTLISADGTIS